MAEEQGKKKLTDAASKLTDIKNRMAAVTGNTGFCNGFGGRRTCCLGSFAGYAKDLICLEDELQGVITSLTKEA